MPIPFRYTGPLKPENKYGHQPAAEGDGINAATGNYTYSNADLTVPGRGIPLTINRSYNSLDTSAVSPFGYGWNFNYSTTVFTDVYGNPTVLSGDGRRDQFTRQDTSIGVTYVPYAGVSAKLEYNVDGTWKLTQMDRNVLNFDSQGRLTSQADANGNTTTLTYDEWGRVSRVTDAPGRAIVFTYNANGYIESITTDIPGFDPWTVSYSYNGDDLTGFTEPDGHSWTYHYYDNTHRIREIIDPRGNPYVTLTYNAEGKVQTQLDAEGRDVALVYYTGKTDITDNDNQKTKYFDDQFNLIRQEDTDGVTEFGYTATG
ncbi:MAG: hypothetical protein CVV34_05285, partial [Methanomicrobiales archaeon HGW-Methanomicrobiales-5]